MARRLPWVHGVERDRSEGGLSARGRVCEALLEAQSSLEQFSGIPVRPRKRNRIAGLCLFPQLLSVGWRRVCRCQLASWLAGPIRRKATRHRSIPVVSSGGFSWTRLVSHSGILLLLAVLLLGGGLRGVLAQPVQTNAGGVALVSQRVVSGGETEGLLSNYISIPAVPVVIQKPRLSAPGEIQYEEETVEIPLRTEVTYYHVQDGDTLGSIAVSFGLSVETLYWFNGLKNADILSIGQELKIPPVDGLVHTVGEGESLDSIAEHYGVRKGNMIAYAGNDLREPYELEEGQDLFVPGAAKPIPRPAVTQTWSRPSYMERLSAPPYGALPGGERFSWPAAGTITDRFGWTGTRWHTGLDIAAPWGTPIYSAAAGTVTFSGWRGSLGYCVEINHGEGWVTRYGHMAQQPEVWVGQWVERSQLIGFIGCTGKCTGPHVHFEVIYNGDYADPLNYLQ